MGTVIVSDSDCATSSVSSPSSSEIPKKRRSTSSSGLSMRISTSSCSLLPILTTRVLKTAERSQLKNEGESRARSISSSFRLLSTSRVSVMMSLCVPLSESPSATISIS